MSPDKTIQVKIITPDRVVFEGGCDSLVYPGEDGLYGVLNMHAPMITTVGAGYLELRHGSSTLFFFLTEGFVEIQNNEVHFAVSGGEAKEEIDLERAKASADRARAMIDGQARPDDFDLMRAKAALQRALLRQRLAGK